MARPSPPRRDSRLLTLRLYPDCSDHVKALDNILRNEDCAYILHSNDECKPHWHVVVYRDRFAAPITVSAFVKRYGVGLSEFTVDDVRIVDDKRAILRYLRHLDDPDKYQYPAADVLTTSPRMSDECSKAWSDYSSSGLKEEFQFSAFLVWLDSCHSAVTFHDATQFALDNNIYSVYRRSFSLVRELIREHNEVYLH